MQMFEVFSGNLRWMTEIHYTFTNALSDNTRKLQFVH